MPQTQQPPLSPAIEEDWDFATADTMYLTHGLHPYLASMIPQIPARLLKMYGKPGMRIFDPFVGGGAVLVEAYLAGLVAYGTDVNPLATLITRAKTTPIPAEILQKARTEFERVFPDIAYTVPEFSEKSKVAYWFKPYMFEKLAQIKAAVDQTIILIDLDFQDALKNLLDCIFSHTVRSVSLTYRNEVRLRRLEPADLERFNPDVSGEFRKRLDEAFKRIAQLPAMPTIPYVIQGDARKLEFRDKEFDLVITSPPYGDLANTIPYHQFSKNMLYWLGMMDSDIATIRHNSLGSKMTSVDGFPRVNSFSHSIAQMSKVEATRDATLFYSDYYRAMQEISRVTSQRIIIVVGHRVLNDVLIDNATITTEIMHNLGWELETCYNRLIARKRLNKKMGMGSNFQGATIDREAILVYQPT